MNAVEIRESNLPGADVVSKGLQDLEQRTVSNEALLVLAASSRLRRLGIDVPQPAELSVPPERALYELLEASYGNDAHSKYNALIRQIVSFARALEREMGARIRKAATT